MLLSNGVFHPADVVLQHFALVPAQLTGYGFAALVFAERESRKAEGRHGEFGAALRQIPTAHPIRGYSAKDVRGTSLKRMERHVPGMSDDGESGGQFLFDDALRQGRLDENGPIG